MWYFKVFRKLVWRVSYAWSGQSHTLTKQSFWFVVGLRWNWNWNWNQQQIEKIDKIESNQQPKTLLLPSTSAKLCFQSLVRFHNEKLGQRNKSVQEKRFQRFQRFQHFHLANVSTFVDWAKHFPLPFAKNSFFLLNYCITSSITPSSHNLSVGSFSFFFSSTKLKYGLSGSKCQLTGVLETL